MAAPARTVVAWERGARFLSADGAGITRVALAEDDDEEDEDETDEDLPAVEARRTLAERERESDLERTPGGMYEVALDPDHWMAFGLPERMAVLKRGDDGFAVTEEGVNVAGFAEESLLSGYARPGLEEELAKKSWLIVEGVGRGQAVLFADNPLYRMFLEGQHQLVLNAVVLGTGFGGGGRFYR